MGSKCSKCSTKEYTQRHISRPHTENQVENSLKDSILQLSLDDSLLTLEKILQKHPESPELLTKIACHLSEKGLSAQALECFTQLSAQNAPLSSKAVLTYAQILVQYKSYDKAIGVLNRALESNPLDHKAHAYLSEIYSDRDDNELAFKHISAALEIEGNIAEYYNSCGLCKMKDHEFEEALEMFLKAFQIDSNMAKALNNAGNAYRKLGNASEAIKCYNTAINLIPKRKFPIALINLATACFYMGDMILTLAYFEEALQTGANIHKIMVKKGYHLLFKSPRTKLAIELLYKQDYSKSVQMLNEILEADPNNPVVSYFLGVALSKLNKTSESTTHFQATISNGVKPIYANKQFVRHFVKRANKVLNKSVSKRMCSEIPEVDEDSENSTINIGALEVFKVRAVSLAAPYNPRIESSPCESPLDTSIDDEAERCRVM